MVNQQKPCRTAELPSAKILQIIIAAAIPVASLIRPIDAIVPGILGALVLVVDGVQELEKVPGQLVKVPIFLPSAAT